MSHETVRKSKSCGHGNGCKQGLKYLEKDPETNFPKLMDLIDKYSPEDWYKTQREAVRNAIKDKDNNWYKLILRIYELDPSVRKTFFENFIINASLKGGVLQDRFAEENNCYSPWAILLDPTSACNLKCTGCWAAEYGHQLNLSLEEIDSIIRQGKEIGVYMYIYTGGEPTVRKKDLIKLCEMHPDCEFLAYLIVDDTAYILGGRNTYDYFLGDQEGKKNYDWDILVYSTGAGNESSLNEVKDYFLSVWNLSDSKTIESSFFWKKNPVVAEAKEELQTIWDSLTEDHADWLAPVDYESITVPVNNITLVSNPIQTGIKEPVVFYEITELMMQAKESVVFHTPYIVCNEWMTERLTQLCDTVDEVVLMTNSIANNGNYFGAADYSVHKEEILETGAQILEYDGGISYHGKCFVIDDRISAIGSFNLDMRSTYIDTETMLVIDSEELNQQLREAMEEYETDALTVVDIDTSIPPEGESARGVSKSKNRMIQLLLPFERIRFII